MYSIYAGIIFFFIFVIFGHTVKIIFPFRHSLWCTKSDNEIHSKWTNSDFFELQIGKSRWICLFQNCSRANSITEVSTSFFLFSLSYFPVSICSSNNSRLRMLYKNNSFDVYDWIFGWAWIMCIFCLSKMNITIYMHFVSFRLFPHLKNIVLFWLRYF